MACDIIVLGSVNTDLVIRGPRLPALGETVVGGDFFQTQGGKGANQAVATARLSISPVLFVATVGDDELGAASRAALATENLRLDYLRSVTDAPSGVALIMVGVEGENLISVASGANAQLAKTDVDRIPAAVWRDAKVFLACLESPPETVAHALRRAKEFGLTTISSRITAPQPDPATPVAAPTGHSPPGNSPRRPARGAWRRADSTVRWDKSPLAARARGNAVGTAPRSA